MTSLASLSLGQWLFIGIAVIFLIIAIIKFGKKLTFQAIGTIIIWMFMALGWIILSPFRGIKALFTKTADNNKRRKE